MDHRTGTDTGATAVDPDGGAGDRTRPGSPPRRADVHRRPSIAERLLDGAAAGALSCDERMVVRSANTAALRLLPGLTVGEVVHDELAGSAEAERVLEVAGRELRVVRQELPGGWTGWHLDDVTEQNGRLDSLLAERARSQFLALASSRLGLSLHPGRTARAVAELAVRIADTAVVVLPARHSVEWFRCEAGGRPVTGVLQREGLPDPVAAALAGLAVEPGPLLPAQLTGEPWESADAEDSAVVITLPGNGHPAGALVLVRRATGSASDEPDAALVAEFAQRAGIALAAAGLYAQQVRTAGVLKRTLMEPELPEVAGATLGAAYRPADEGLLIGGDFYDVHPSPRGGAMFLLGDVCGKGVDAAVATGQVRQSVQALRRLEPDPLRLLGLLNDTMLESVPDDADPRFASLVLGTCHPLPGGGLRVELAGGGHPPPLVVRADGVEAVEIGGTLVGVLPDAPFHRRTVDLAPGESCVLYTDGVIEARGGVDGRRLFGERRLAESLRGCHVLPAPGIAERVTQRAVDWLTAGNHDDIAVLVLQAPLPVGPVTARRHLHAVHAERDGRIA